MQLPSNSRRQEISRADRNADWKSLEQLGLEIIEPPQDVACFEYILSHLDVEKTAHAVSTLVWLPRRSRRVDGIVFYREPTTVPLHFGIYAAGKVTSKWERNGPLLRHNLEDIPWDYGSIAEFCSMKKAREAFEQNQAYRSR